MTGPEIARCLEIIREVEEKPQISECYRIRVAKEGVVQSIKVTLTLQVCPAGVGESQVFEEDGGVQERLFGS